MGLVELVKMVDIPVGQDKHALLYRARNIVSELLDPYALFHTKLVVQLVKELGGDEIDVAAAWLHDIGKAISEKEHRKIGEEWAHQWLREFKITETERGCVLDAIKNHGSSCTPTTETGKRVKLADALAMFDKGWVYMITTYFKETGQSKEGVKQFQKKWKVIEDMGTTEQKEQCKRTLEWVISTLAP